MIVPTGSLDHEVRLDGPADAAAFDREGYSVGRGVLPPDLLRAVRAPLVEALVADGCVEPVEGEQDRLRCLGDGAGLAKREYRDVVQRNVDELLLESGIAGRAIEASWGRRPTIWNRLEVFFMIPGGSTEDVHRDGWQMMGIGGAQHHVNLWVPLTALGEDDGALAVAVRSHRIPDRLPDVPMPHPIHLDVIANTGKCPPAKVLAPLWRTTRFTIGDALVFRPDTVHGTTANLGSCLRVAIVLLAQDSPLPLPVSAGLSLDIERHLSDIEYLTLALLTLQPTSPWLARCAFYSRGIVGRIWREQPADLVERAFLTLHARELIERYEPLDDDGRWMLRYFRATRRGRLDAIRWLTTSCGCDAPMLALKLLFCDWLDLDNKELLGAI
jgi:hypothetical protein